MFEVTMTKRAVFTVTDPSTSMPLAKYDGITDDEAHAFVRAAKAAFHVWRKTDFAERTALFAVIDDYAETCCAAKTSWRAS